MEVYWLPNIEGNAYGIDVGAEMSYISQISQAVLLEPKKFVTVGGD